MTLPKTASDGTKSGSDGCFYCFSDGRRACFSLSMASIDPTKLRIYFGLSVSVSAMLVSMRQKNIAQVSILERYFFVSTYQAAGPDTCLAVFVVASLPPCL